MGKLWEIFLLFSCEMLNNFGPFGSFSFKQNNFPSISPRGQGCCATTGIPATQVVDPSNP
jgi:hypothetical protein